MIKDERNLPSSEEPIFKYMQNKQYNPKIKYPIITQILCQPVHMVENTVLTDMKKDTTDPKTCAENETRIHRPEIRLVMESKSCIV